MPRFVILDHDYPVRHWDFMLEWGDRLRTWRLLSEPIPGPIIQAEILGDHRRDYLTYEGPLSGKRGRVVQWDAGSYELASDEPACLQFALKGKRLGGNVTLAFTRDGEWTWQMTQS